MITIIVMLILAGVTIAALTSENGIINQASKVKETNKVAKTEEDARLEYSNLVLEKQMEGHGENPELSEVIEKLEENGYETAEKDGKNYIKIGDYYYEIKLENEQVSIAREKTEVIAGGNNGGNGGSGTEANNSESYVGYYADVDGDGTVDGIIYADRVIGNTEGKSPWINSDGAYTIDTIAAEAAKTYQVSEENYTEGKFGEQKIITGTGSGADRFYAMALNNIGTSYYWYKNALLKMNVSDTQTEFGKGKSNTTTINNKWLANDADGYGLQNTYDMWGQIQEEIRKGWFVPSKAEWSAFAGELGITKSNYSSKGLNS